MSDIKAPKKLIEVALPLDDINKACIREKSIRHGHPSTLHLWWARRPLAAARAVLFAQCVNDPGGERGYKAGKTRKQADNEREELFDIIRDLVKWENTNNETVLKRARLKIRESWRETCELNKGKSGFDPDKLPAFHDPFAGGGAIPLEAQRLGFESYASDLNPVAVMINKAMIEIPPRFNGNCPVNPDSCANNMATWTGARGLADDVRYYGKLLRDQAFAKIGHLYPQIDLPGQQVGGKATVIAWIWARTVKSPNPAFSGVHVPLISTYYLCKKDQRKVWLQPVLDGDDYRFEIKEGKPDNPAEIDNGTKLGRGANFKCIMSDTPMTSNYVRGEFQNGRAGVRLIAVVAEGTRGRLYIPATAAMQALAETAAPTWKPTQKIPINPRWFSPPLYGMTSYGDIFTNRQLTALTTFCDLLPELREFIKRDAFVAGLPDDSVPLRDGGNGATAYAEAVSVYLGFAVDRSANYWSSLTPWGGDFIVQTFGRQALPMVWDFAEGNPFSESTGCFHGAITWIETVISNQFNSAKTDGISTQQDAVGQTISESKIISTDPPYYDNIGYADLSDFFYIWMRKSCGDIYPDLFVTITTPKTDELIASPYRHESKLASETFFLNGMTKAMGSIGDQTNKSYPITIYYAFKQSDSDSSGTVSTGWETFLQAVINSRLVLTGTWPMRTERDQGLKTSVNVLASSIILVCRRRNKNATDCTRKEFLRELKAVMPEALETMIGGAIGRSPLAAVDLAQAAIGPGMEVFSKYAAVLEADGSAMSVKTALQLINKQIDEYFGSEENNFDPETRFCCEWFKTYGWKEGPFGDANTLANAKAVSVSGLEQSGVLTASGGKVKLLTNDEYPSDWNPLADTHNPVWESAHQLIRELQTSGEVAAGKLLAKVHKQNEQIRKLCYQQYTWCERTGRAGDAKLYNELLAAWHAIESAALEHGAVDEQPTLF